jgi:hypothetical protein
MRLFGRIQRLRVGDARRSGHGASDTDLSGYGAPWIQRVGGLIRLRVAKSI